MAICCQLRGLQTQAQWHGAVPNTRLCAPIAHRKQLRQQQLVERRRALSDEGHALA